MGTSCFHEIFDPTLQSLKYPAHISHLSRRSLTLAHLNMLPCYMKSTSYSVARTQFEECKRQSRREKLSGLTIMIPKTSGDRDSTEPGISRERSLTTTRFPFSKRGSMDVFNYEGFPCILKIDQLMIHTESG